MDKLEEKIISYISGPDAGNPIHVPEDRTDKYSIEQLVKNDSIFNQKITKYLQPLIVQSIIDYGVDTAKNKFLSFVNSTNLDKLKNPIPLEHGKMIMNELQSGDMKVPTGIGSHAGGSGDKAGWLFDDRTYQGDIYKLQALLLLSDPDRAVDFGDLRTRPWEDILNAKSRMEIEQILTNWQTKSGEEGVGGGARRAAKRFKAALKDKVPDTVEEWIEYVKRTFKETGSTSLDKVEGIAKKIYKKGMSRMEAWNQLMTALAETSKADTPAKAEAPKGEVKEEA